MTGWPDIDITDAEAVADRRDEVVAAVRDHAGQIAYALARLQGGDYGQRTVDTDDGAWTVKYEAGDLEYLRFDPKSGSEVYVVSTKQPPEPEPLATALADYDAFVAAFDEHVASLAGVLDGSPTEFPDPAPVDGVVAERDRIVGAIRDTCDAIAHALRRYEGGDYGTFATRVDGTRWELKWDEDGTSYLRVGGEGGIYLLSQYAPPAAPDLREYAPQFSGFVDAYNEYVDDLESDLATVSL
ncbi:hypothetical protein [Halorientalis regularis]|uniref:Profilin fold domain-containing protein n=1 Tax=Halorientalis regularis TaxID=660518 RepID=A0A1G7JVE8_9EURY|nr:hypothetical protein [Halorientalis regularis]SDF28940.1 hypothetical protein SAMN05216218_10576 [Halorientalis regularis]